MLSQAALRQIFARIEFSSFNPDDESPSANDAPSENKQIPERKSNNSHEILVSNKKSGVIRPARFS